jgi:hypothetical protein
LRKKERKKKVQDAIALEAKHLFRRKFILLEYLEKKKKRKKERKKGEKRKPRRNSSGHKIFI